MPTIGLPTYRTVRFLIMMLVIAAVCMASTFAFCPDDITDPLGDMGQLQTEGSMLDLGYTDIVSAWARPAYDYPAIELGVRVAEQVPNRPDVNFNLFFFFDSDENIENNDPAGTRAGADTAFSLMYGLERQERNTLTWSYDADTKEWNASADQGILFALDGDMLIMHVPFELFPEVDCHSWRAAAAAAKGEESSVDTVPEGEGNLQRCCTEGEKIISGIPEQSEPVSEPVADTPTPTETASSSIPWARLMAILFIAGAGIAIGKKSKKEKSPVFGEEVPCTCKTCSMFITVGNKSNKPIASAANLGKGIKRDTETSTTIPADDKCLKVAHFYNSKMTRGRYVTSDGKGNTSYETFIKMEQLTAVQQYDDIKLRNEVMIVNHGESSSKTAAIMRSLRTLIPQAPIKKLVLYYCGGEGSLPKKEFKSLAAELGRRLKRIEKKCRPKFVEVWLAPTIQFCDKKEHFTKLSLQAHGLVSFQGMMTKYTIDENGVVTDHGNTTPPGGQLFGKTKLGKLHSNPILNAEMYYHYWKEVCCLDYSEIVKRRATIEKYKDDIAGYKKPNRLCPAEAKANKIQKFLEGAGVQPLTPTEMDEALHCKNKKALKAYLKSVRG